MMFIVKNQTDLDNLISVGPCDVNVFNIDLFVEREFFLEGDYFVLDCSAALLNCYHRIEFQGNPSTKVKLINCEEGPTGHIDFSKPEVVQEQVPTFNFSDSITFRNIYLTAEVLTEISFFDRSDMGRWENVRCDPEKIRVLIIEEDNDRFFSFLEKKYSNGVLKKGDHVVVDRGVYTHHGIYIGLNELIHYSGDLDSDGNVKKVSLEEFAKDDLFWVYKHDDAFNPSTVVDRAKSRLGESDYNLIFNNCEHFSHWCCTGQAWSNQIIFGVYIGNLANDADAPKYRLER